MFGVEPVLKTRALESSDLALVKTIHDLYYSEFEFPRFKELMCGFIIEDENEEFVMAGGVEAIGEAVLVTNKDKSEIKIGKSLVLAQNISHHICKKYNIKELHAFVNNQTYIKHLVKHGFEERKERVLRMRIE